MTEPMVQVIEMRCPNCERVCRKRVQLVLGAWTPFPFTVTVQQARRLAEREFSCAPGDNGCRWGGRFLIATEPVPGMGTPYPATERDEDSEYEYAREDAPLPQEDRR